MMQKYTTLTLILAIVAALSSVVSAADKDAAVLPSVEEEETIEKEYEKLTPKEHHSMLRRLAKGKSCPGVQGSGRCNNPREPFCCNPSCGYCVAAGGFCTQEFCPVPI